MFTAALLVIAKIWKQPRCPSTDEWIKKNDDLDFQHDSSLLIYAHAKNAMLSTKYTHYSRKPREKIFTMSSEQAVVG